MCGPANEIKVTILEDGTVKLETGAVDVPVHMAAEKLWAALARELGGSVERVKAKHVHAHEHVAVTKKAGL